MAATAPPAPMEATAPAPATAGMEDSGEIVFLVGISAVGFVDLLGSFGITRFLYVIAFLGSPPLSVD